MGFGACSGRKQCAGGIPGGNTGLAGRGRQALSLLFLRSHEAAWSRLWQAVSAPALAQRGDARAGLVLSGANLVYQTGRDTLPGRAVITSSAAQVATAEMANDTLAVISARTPGNATIVGHMGDEQSNRVMIHVYAKP